MARRTPEVQDSYEAEIAAIRKLSDRSLKVTHKAALALCEGQTHWSSASQRLSMLNDEVERRTNLTYWVMSLSGFNSAGSYSHVSHGDTLHETEEACQAEIDNMKGWIGMGDRSRYRPLPLKFKRNL